MQNHKTKVTTNRNHVMKQKYYKLVSLYFLAQKTRRLQIPRILECGEECAETETWNTGMCGTARVIVKKTDSKLCIDYYCRRVAKQCNTAQRLDQA